MNTQTILVVDDDAEIREGIRILLTGESYNNGCRRRWTWSF